METINREKNSLEILNDFASKSGRRIETSEDRLSSTGIYTLQHTKRTAFMQNNSQDDLSFYWYNNPKSFSAFPMYSGVFSKTMIPENTKFNIRKKYFSDKFMLPSKNKRLKTGDDRFDSKFLVTGQNNEDIQPILNRLKVQNLISEIIDFDQRIQISFNSFSPDFGPLKDHKTLLGIFIRDFWILESEAIEKILNLSSLLKKEFD